MDKLDENQSGIIKTYVFIALNINMIAKELQELCNTFKKEFGKRSEDYLMTASSFQNEMAYKHAQQKLLPALTQIQNSSEDYLRTYVTKNILHHDYMERLAMEQNPFRMPIDTGKEDYDVRQKRARQEPAASEAEPDAKRVASNFEELMNYIQEEDILPEYEKEVEVATSVPSETTVTQLPPVTTAAPQATTANDTPVTTAVPRVTRRAKRVTFDLNKA